MDLATVELLTSAEGASLLAAMPPYDEASALALGTGLRDGGYSPELVAAVLTQSRLRARAQAKFGEFAAGMLFTPDGLEQATRLPVAARHAQRYRVAGIGHVADLGCGIGADAMALAALGLDVTAWDIDDATAAIAAHNLRHFPDVRARVGRAEDVQIPDGHGAWLDPARRTPGRTDAAGRTSRVFRLDAISPSWQDVRTIAARVPATGVKLAPSFPHAQVPAGAEAAWTSLDGEVLECAVWWGPLVHTPGRTATVLRAGTVLQLTQADVPDGPVGDVAPRPGGWLYEPDPAVLQAGLVGALEGAVDGAEAGVGYVASDHEVDVPYARRFRVIEVLPTSAKRVSAALRAHGIGAVTIKRRGGRLDPQTFRRSLRLHGGQDHGTVVLTAQADRPLILLVIPA